MVANCHARNRAWLELPSKEEKTRGDISKRTPVSARNAPKLITRSVIIHEDKKVNALKRLIIFFIVERVKNTINF